jgi:hypothetical protein
MWATGTTVELDVRNKPVSAECLPGRSCSHCHVASSRLTAGHFVHHSTDKIDPCVNRRVANTCDRRSTHCGAAVLPSTHVRRWVGGNPKEVGGEAMPAWSCTSLVGKRRFYIYLHLSFPECVTQASNRSAASKKSSHSPKRSELLPSNFKS